MCLGYSKLQTRARFGLVLAASFVCTSVCAAPLHAGPPAAKDSRRTSTVYILKQMTRQGGAETLFVSDTAVRIVQENGGKETLAQAPDWKTVVINRAHRTYFVAKNDSQSLLMQRFLIIEGGTLAHAKWKVVEKAKIAGLDAERLVDEKSMHLDPNLRFESFPDELKICGFWVASNLKLAPAAANVVAHIRGCPPIGKLPLKFMHVTQGNRKYVVIDTLSFQTKVMPVAAFNIPAGFQRTLSDYDGELKNGLLDELVKQSEGEKK